MTYFQYFLKNSKWLAAFAVAFIAFVLYCAFADQSEYLDWNLGFVGFIAVILCVAIVGDYLAWKRLKR